MSAKSGTVGKLRSFPTYENSNLYFRGRRRWFLPRNQSSKSRVSIFGALSIFRQSHFRENLEQASGGFPICRQNLGLSENCDHSRHMKTQICTFGDVGDGFYLVTNPLNRVFQFLAHFPFFAKVTFGRI